MAQSEDWRDSALCAQTDPELFFPDKGGSVRDARRVCMACPVRAVCLEWSLDQEIEIGVWGGLTAQQRVRLIRDRHRAARVAA